MSPVPFPTPKTYEAVSHSGPSFLFASREFYFKNISLYIKKYFSYSTTGVLSEEVPLLSHGNLRFIHWFYGIFKDTLPPRFNEYRYIKKFFILNLHYHPPKSHLVLKAPQHCFHLNELMTEFDESFVVLLHRNPYQIVLSACNLEMILHSFLVRDLRRGEYAINNVEYGKRLLKAIQYIHENVIEVRKRNPHFNKRILDVQFTELIKDPMKIVRQIYAFSGLQLTPDVEKAMIASLPTKKKAKSQYNMSAFGLSEEDINRSFPDSPRKQ